MLEATLSTILDLEDSVAAVDAEDKGAGLQQLAGHPGHADRAGRKGGKTFTRGLNPDRVYTGPSGKGRSAPAWPLADVRAQCGPPDDQPGHPGPDGGGSAKFPKASWTRWSPPPSPCTTCKAMVPTASATAARGSVYIVKPKMHGPAEVAFAAELFGRVEKLLGLPDSTVKLGIMDEERRTSVNLKACIAAASSRVAFINTGFLDRTGDEMHTAMQAGPMVLQGRHEDQRLDPAYEKEQRAGGPEPAACAARRRSARHVGHARPDGRHAEAEIAPGRRQHRLGAQPHRRHAARHALPPGEGGRHQKRAGKTDADAERDNL